MATMFHSHQDQYESVQLVKQITQNHRNMFMSHAVDTKYQGVWNLQVYGNILMQCWIMQDYSYCTENFSTDLYKSDGC